MKEVKETLKKFKRHKAPGPDEIPMEFFKEITDVKLDGLLEVLNDWWKSEEVPEEQLQARIVLIFKKGDSSDLDKYRPISLLNALYKIFAAIIQKRLAATIDPFLQKTQYGFRKEKSTAQAIHIIRIMDTGIRANIGISVVLLDWEKAFDKVTHKGLHDALERMGIHPKLRNLVKQLYKNPTFKIEFEGGTSQWKQQKSGIRQGCPLSPYLFLIIMTVMFHEVNKDKK